MAQTTDARLPASPPPDNATTAAVPAESCRIVTDRAMAADLRAGNAQTQKGDAEHMGRLLDDAIGLWTLASERCTDRAQERARRNLADSQRSRQALSAELGAGPECASRQKDANSLQDLAQQAVKARRWLDASVLYRKAENMWDVAAERCTGDPQKLALQRRDQTATDAHNAELCGPIFERAREATQLLSQQRDPQQHAERQHRSQVAETLWRDAMAQCKGQPVDIAHTNMQRLAKERGTPWVPTQARSAEPPGQASTAMAARPQSVGVSTAVTPHERPIDSPQTSASALKAASVGTAEALKANTPQDMDIQAGDTRFQGRFTRQDGLLTGSGRVTWTNGDAYNGELVQGKRHGQGEFIWANGQRFRGNWVQDTPHGKGNMKFASGNQYDGDIAQGEPHGEGRMVFASGDQFQGRFVKGKPNGQGTYRWASGQVYEGPWVNEQPNGKGKMIFANGNRYEGTLADGQPSGIGRLNYASGDEYAGQFKTGVPHGEGTYSWKAGDRYTGMWHLGLKHGRGKFEWPNGDRWEGLFENDAQTNQGILTRKAP